MHGNHLAMTAILPFAREVTRELHDSGPAGTRTRDLRLAKPTLYH